MSRSSQLDRFPRLRLEQCEPRETPALFLVATATDTHPDAGGSFFGLDPFGNAVGDLRYAITQANATPGVDTIQFLTTAPIQLNAALPDLVESVIIEGAGGRIDASAIAGPVFTFSNPDSLVPATFTLRQLTITGGSASGLVTQALPNDGTEATLILDRVWVTGNTTTTSGGGLFAGSRWEIMIVGSTFSNNLALGDGGAIAIDDAQVIAINSTFSGNFAGGNGGGIAVIGGDPLLSQLSLINVTITANHAELGGGVFGSLAPDETVTLANSVIAGNSADLAENDIFGDVISLGGNFIGASAGAGWLMSDMVGSALVPLDPLLTDLIGSPYTAVPVHLPRAGSPLLGLGVTGVGEPVDDQLGSERIGSITAGAVQRSTLLVTTNADSGVGSLRQALLDAEANPGLDLIEFDLPPGLLMITLESALPIVTDVLIIDGATQSGGLVRINGIDLEEADGLTVGSGGILGVNALGLRSFTNGAGLRGLDNSVLIVSNSQIGTNQNGNIARPNQDGVRSAGFVSLVDNLISGNSRHGVFLEGSATGWLFGNLIGTAIDGTSDLGNGSAGVFVESDLATVTIGAPGQGNVIAFNADGVVAVGGSLVSIRDNAIFSNAVRGIDRGPTAPPTPVLATLAGGTLTGVLRGDALTEYVVEIYLTATTGLSGQGRTLIATLVVTTDINGFVSFTVTGLTDPENGDLPLVLGPGRTVVATATHAFLADTSEFSAGLATQLLISGGKNQTTSAGTAYTVPLAVRLADVWGQTVALDGVSVTFSDPAGANFSGNRTVLTDITGRATAPTLIAGTQPRSVVVAASSAGLLGINFTLTIVAGPVASLTLAGPSSGIAGQSASYTVTARDAFGNLVTGAVVATLTTSAAVSGLPSTITIVGGQASVSLMFLADGPVTLTARSGPSVTTSLTATIAPAFTPSPAVFMAQSGLNFSGTVGTFTTTSSGPFTASINWGDGTVTSGQVRALSGGGFRVEGQHTFATDATFTVTVTVTSSLGLRTVMSSSAVVVTQSQSAGLTASSFVRSQPGDTTLATQLGSISAELDLLDPNADVTLFLGEFSGDPQGVFQPGPDRVFVDIRVTSPEAIRRMTVRIDLPPAYVDGPVEIMYFDREAGEYRIVVLEGEFEIDLERRVVTLVIDASTTPNLRQLDGTVFTVALPTPAVPQTVGVPQPVTVVSAGNGVNFMINPPPLTTPTTFATGGQLTLSLTPIVQTQIVTSRSQLSAESRYGVEDSGHAEEPEESERLTQLKSALRRLLSEALRQFAGAAFWSLVTPIPAGAPGAATGGAPAAATGGPPAATTGEVPAAATDMAPAAESQSRLLPFESEPTDEADWLGAWPPPIPLAHRPAGNDPLLMGAVVGIWGLASCLGRAGPPRPRRLD